MAEAVRGPGDGDHRAAAALPAAHGTRAWGNRARSRGFWRHHGNGGRPALGALASSREPAAARRGRATVVATARVAVTHRSSSAWRQAARLRRWRTWHLDCSPRVAPG